MGILLYILPILIFYKLTTKQQRADWMIYFWVFVFGFGVLGFLFELFRTGKFPPPVGS